MRIGAGLDLGIRGVCSEELHFCPALFCLRLPVRMYLPAQYSEDFGERRHQKKTQLGLHYSEIAIGSANAHENAIAFFKPARHTVLWQVASMRNVHSRMKYLGLVTLVYLPNLRAHEWRVAPALNVHDRCKQSMPIEQS